MATRIRFALAVLAGVGFAAFESSHPWPTVASHVGILSAIVVMLVVIVVAGRGRQRIPSRAWVAELWHRAVRRPDRRWWAGAGWVVAVVLVAGWDLTSFLARSAALPTLSRLIGAVTRYDVGRAVAIALWLALGGWIALAGRRTVEEP